MIITDKNMEFGGYMTGWCEAKYFKPNELEHIVFKCERGGTEWFSGTYYAEDNTIRRLIARGPVPIYHTVDFEDVTYWMRIPPAPGEEK